MHTNEDLHYWREGNYEVDYVQKKGRIIWAIEVKSGSIHNKKGLAAFKKIYPEACLVVIDKNNYFDF